MEMPEGGTDSRYSNLLGRWLCKWQFHTGEPFAEGHVEVYEKRNNDGFRLTGRYKIRKCSRCGEEFSLPNDYIEF